MKHIPNPKTRNEVSKIFLAATEVFKPLGVVIPFGCCYILCGNYKMVSTRANYKLAYDFFHQHYKPAKAQPYGGYWWARTDFKSRITALSSAAETCLSEESWISVPEPRP